VFVAKIDPGGKYIWATSGGGDERDFGLGIALDSAGNSYVTGCFRGTSTFGATTLKSVGPRDIFVAKIGPTGKFIWATAAATGWGGGAGSGIAVDSKGNSYVVGTFGITATFGGITLGTKGYAKDVFIAKLDPNGKFIGAIATGLGNQGMTWEDIAVDSSGNVYATGGFAAPFYGTPLLTSAGKNDIFVVKYQPSGKLIWAASAGGASGDNGAGIAIDAAGNSYVTGYFTGSAKFGTTTLASGGATDDDVFVAKLSSAGKFVWARSAGSTGADHGYAIDVDGSGNSYVTGDIEGPASFGTTTLKSVSWDIFVAKVDSSGTFIWATSAGGKNWYDSGLGIAVDGAGKSHVTGCLGGPAYFGTTFVNATATEGDIFVWKLAAGTP
jgi:hypothetical protein